MQKDEKIKKTKIKKMQRDGKNNYLKKMQNDGKTKKTKI